MLENAQIPAENVNSILQKATKNSIIKEDSQQNVFAMEEGHGVFRG